MGTIGELEVSATDDRWEIVKVAWGWCAVARSERGLTRISLPASRAEAQAAVTAWGERRRNDPLLRETGALLVEYFDGEPVQFELPLDLRGVGAFDLRVLQACGRVPYGATISYGRLAQMAGSPRGARAAGRALGRNPLPVVIPCHRVIGSDGRLVGFGGGLELKRRLLTLEGAAV
ncbi:MAG: methylated-DNA--[protein]-cysteine S-methyltransferase [Armatimonadota bacterium]